MRVRQQPAYVLHARPWRETSLLLECLTREHGRIGLVARGVRGARSRGGGRAALEPFHLLALDFLLRGELGTLTAVEAGVPLPLAGDALLAGLYLNELTVRLSGRQDPHPALFAAYGEALVRLSAGATLGWTLRRFERDLLGTLGYAPQLEREVDDGAPVLPEATYVYLPEHGPQRWHGQPGVRVSGAALLALASDREPDAAAQAELRRLLRSLIGAVLGGSELRSRRVLGDALRGR